MKCLTFLGGAFGQLNARQPKNNKQIKVKKSNCLTGGADNKLTTKVYTNLGYEY